MNARIDVPAADSLLQFNASGLAAYLQRLVDRIKAQDREISALKRTASVKEKERRTTGISVSDKMTRRVSDMEVKLGEIVSKLEEVDAKAEQRTKEVAAQIAPIQGRYDPIFDQLAKLDKNLGVHHGLIEDCLAALEKKADKASSSSYALASDVAALQKESTTYARQSSMEALEEAVDAKVDRNKLAIVKSELEYSLEEGRKEHQHLAGMVDKNLKRMTNTDTRIVMIEDAVSNFQAQMDRDFPRVRDAVDEVNAHYAQLAEIVETKAVQKDVEQMWEEVERFATRDALDALQISINDSIRTMEAAVEQNTQNLQSKLAELQQYERKLATKASKVDLTQLQFKINETCVTKHEQASSLKPLIVKHDQFLGKLVDLDRAVSRKADMQTTLEHRDHIQELYHLMQEFQAQIGSGAISTGAPRPSSAAEGGAGPVPPRESSAGGDKPEGGEQKNGKEGTAVTTAEHNALYGKLKEEVARLHAELKEIYEVIVGNKGNLPENNHPNHQLWQQMIAFRKLFVLSGDEGYGDAGVDGETGKRGGDLAKVRSVRVAISK